MVTFLMMIAGVDSSKATNCSVEHSHDFGINGHMTLIALKHNNRLQLRSQTDEIGVSTSEWNSEGVG